MALFLFPVNCMFCTKFEWGSEETSVFNVVEKRKETFCFYQLTHKNYRHGLINHLRGGLISICTKSFLTVPDFSVFLVARGVLEGVQNSPSRAGCHRMN